MCTIRVQYVEGDYIMCMTSRYLLSFFHQCHDTVKSLSLSLYNRSTTSFYFRTVGRTVAGNIEIMSLEIIIYLRCLHWCVSPLCNDMTSRQSSPAEKILYIVEAFFYHHSVVIQHLVSDRLLSLILKENVHNVR